MCFWEGMGGKGKCDTTETHCYVCVIVVGYQRVYTCMHWLASGVNWHTEKLLKAF